MKDAKLLVVGRPHQGNSAVDNVIRYVIASPFADTSEILSNQIRIDSLQHMIEDFYAVQAPLDMNEHRRVFHFVLTARDSHHKDAILMDGAQALLEYFSEIGHQALLVPHYGSEKNYANHHWHVVVNPISYINGQRLLDKFQTFSQMQEYLTRNTRAEWTWKYTVPDKK